VPQVDLSTDNNAQNAESVSELMQSQTLMDRVICKTFAYHHLGVIINDRIRSLFTNKLRRMGKIMQHLGGRGRSNIEEWKLTT